MRGKINEISKQILKGMLLTGVIVIASTSPYFISKAWPKLVKLVLFKLKNDKKTKKKLYNTFYYLKSKGLIKIECRGAQLYISLTEEGKEKAGKYQIDDLKIKKPKKWDKFWRVLIFDISDKHKIKRESLRGKLKELGLFQLQKSVWICPYEFQKEIENLRSFFNFSKDEMNVISASKIENDIEAKKFFKIK